MAKTLNEILEPFYGKLSGSDAVDEKTVTALRSLFESDKRLKADDVVAILSGAVEEPPA